MVAVRTDGRCRAVCRASPQAQWLLITFGIAAVTAVPAMVWLFVLVNRRDWVSSESH